MSPEVLQLNRVLEHLKTKFVGKDDVIDLMGICLAGRENLFLLGPPGTAKSALVRQLGQLIHGKCFEYLLTRFTEPNEIFGPFDIRRLREGDLVTNTEGMLPEADLIFLDELLNANSAILNSLLMVLNERLFRRGRETQQLPVLMIVGASNHLPEDESLRALFDRFLLRVQSDNVAPDMLQYVLDAGWKLEQNAETEAPSIATKDITTIQQMVWTINLSEIRQTYIGVIQQLRNAGVAVSDRRAVKLQRMIAASAVLCGRSSAITSDLWVLRYIWDTEEQREIIAGIVNRLTESDPEKRDQHPRASLSTTPNPDEIVRDVQLLAEKWQQADIALAEQAIIKDKLRYLNSRAAWIANEVQRAFVLERINQLWKKIIQV
jgi:MoxR-like ATPase